MWIMFELEAEEMHYVHEGPQKYTVRGCVAGVSWIAER